MAKIAEQEGIVALAVHGRTRADLYSGEAEYDSIAAIKQAVSIPVLANGDIDSPEKAKAVFAATGDLHRARLGIVLMGQAQARLAGVPQAHVAGDHFRHHHARTQALAELAERPVGDSGHGRENQRVGQSVGADA
ncbi:tRNA-dihydrouridine synthase B [compost metagenome]